MKPEYKKLLLKDLCERLSYGVKIFHRGSVEEIQEITPTGEFKNYNYNAWFSIDTCKPYLRPMSSMTKEENEKAESFANEKEMDYWGLIDFYNSIHIDYRGLIPKGLALEAPEGMYECL